MRRTSLWAIIAACALAPLVASCGGEKLKDGLYARITTDRGEILAGLEYESSPLTVCNFAGLAEGKLDASRGGRFYDGLAFHRVEPGFVVQGGDPKGDGSGGPGYAFPNEISAGLRFDRAGVLGMANAGAHTNGSQFFITLGSAPHLDGGYSIFGKVVSGMEAVEAIRAGDAMRKVEIVRVGKAARAFACDQAAWNRLFSAALGAKREADLAAINGRWPGLAAQESGLLTKLVKEGSGPSPARGQTAVVAYKLMLRSGEVVDSSDMHGGKVDFALGAGRLISGMEIALSGLKRGERRIFVIPPELGYGQAGIPGTPIEPYAFIVFEAELLGVK